MLRTCIQNIFSKVARGRWLGWFWQRRFNPTQARGSDKSKNDGLYVVFCSLCV